METSAQDREDPRGDRLIRLIVASLRLMAFVLALLLAALLSAGLGSALKGIDRVDDIGQIWVSVATFLLLGVLLVSAMSQPHFEKHVLMFQRHIMVFACYALHHLKIRLCRLPSVWALFGAVTIALTLFSAKLHLHVLGSGRLVADAAVFVNEEPLKARAQPAARDLIRRYRRDNPYLKGIRTDEQDFFDALETIFPEELPSDSAEALKRLVEAETMLSESSKPAHLPAFLPSALRMKILSTLYHRTGDTDYLAELDRALQRYPRGLELELDEDENEGTRAAREFVQNTQAGLSLYWAKEYQSYRDLHGISPGSDHLMDIACLIDEAERYLLELRLEDDLSPRSRRKAANNLGDALLIRIQLATDRIDDENRGAAVARVVREHRDRLDHRIAMVSGALREEPNPTFLLTLVQLTALSLVERATRLDKICRDGDGHDHAEDAARFETECAALLRHVGSTLSLGTPAGRVFSRSELGLLTELCETAEDRADCLEDGLEMFCGHLEMLRGASGAAQ